ncbi:hypothetical protein [Modestobacter sp. NPDC049651]|uniref:hypothetical protein n=1 Tax=unclassified Modestobacter TaxID=2643866 RepID=UPI0033FB1596
MSGIVWILIGAVVGVLLLVSWLMDRAAGRRGSRTVAASDITSAVQESHRDARVARNAGANVSQDAGWTSWSRRGR